MFQHPNRRRVYLMRHAEAAYIAEDGTVTDDPHNVPLTATGRQQAANQAALLADTQIDRVVCSGLPRTIETATILCTEAKLFGINTDRVDAGKLNIETQPALAEIRAAAHSYDEKQDAQWIAQLANPWAAGQHAEGRFLEGEKFADFAGRVVPAFDALIGDTSWHSLLLVLHGGTNRMILNHILNLPWQAQASIEQDNACMNIIDVDLDHQRRASRYLLRAANLTSYNLNKHGIVLTNMEHSAQRIAQSGDVKNR